jgi:hypothetical protein
MNGKKIKNIQKMFQFGSKCQRSSRAYGSEINRTTLADAVTTTTTASNSRSNLEGLALWRPVLSTLIAGRSQSVATLEILRDTR